ncbi:hypothetical protein D3C81_2260350 [compost metagenome]
MQLTFVSPFLDILAQKLQIDWQLLLFRQAHQKVLCGPLYLLFALVGVKCIIVGPESVTVLVIDR